MPIQFASLSTLAAFTVLLNVVQVPQLFAADEAEEKEEKEDRGLRFGKIIKIDGESYVISYGKSEQTVKLAKDMKFRYIGFKGAGKEPEAPEVGFHYKTSVDKDNFIHAALISPAFPEPQEIPDKHKLSAEELFKKTDENGNGQVDYVEYSKWIFQSIKHLPDRYEGKFDKDKNDVLDLAEFTESLERLDWFRFSRKSAEKWMKELDKSGNNELEQSEFAPIKASGHSEVDKVFKSADRDKSGGVSVAELKTYLEKTISNKKSTNGRTGNVEDEQ